MVPMGENRSNVTVEQNEAGAVVVTIRPRFRVFRTLLAPALLLAGFFFLVLLAFASMASRWEFQAQLLPVWGSLLWIVLLTIIPSVLAAIVLTVAFTKEVLVLGPDSLQYRCTIFGIGRVWSEENDAIRIRTVRRRLLLSNRLAAFLGISVPRFRLVGLVREKYMGGDVNDADASRLLELLRSKGLLSE